MTWIHYAAIFAVLGALTVSAAWALWWAIRGGQMSDFNRGATSIFDADEPIGVPTDFFPGGGTGKPRGTNGKRS